MDPNQASSILAQIPQSLRNELIGALSTITTNYRERRWEPAELNGGKLCEVAYSILRGYVDGTMPTKASKPRNMVDACRDLEREPKTHPQSVRITIPRMLIALYEIRNNRGVGHVGGDVDANHMDSTVVVAMSKWIVAEFVRLFHQVTIDEATQVVEALSDRTLPIIWEVGNVKRVLNTSLSMRERTLLLLYSEPTEVPEATLVSWIEHSNRSVYRRDILRKLHKDKMVEYDEKRRVVQISPTGISHVETHLPLDLTT